MDSHTKQEEFWSGDFGKNYTERNVYDKTELDHFYTDLYGITRSEMNNRFLSGLDKNIRILEVGANIGNQLICLQEMGYKNLYGIELQSYAVEQAKSRTHNINIIQGSAFDIPFKDGYFDLVFTSGVLIHISPDNINQVLSEIYRCSNKYIWGFEYYSDALEEINYRGNSNLLWKRNFAQLYLDNFSDLQLIKEEKYKYVSNDNVDQMFMIKK